MRLEIHAGQTGVGAAERLYSHRRNGRSHPGLLERWLGEAGYTVVAGSRATAAPHDAREEAPRLVIANISRPRGAEALIRSLRARYPAPILVISVRFRRGLEASASAAWQLGVRKVLPRPFPRRELLAAVRESLES
jgi:DNA-binding response OmpR family regulator